MHPAYIHLERHNGATKTSGLLEWSGGEAPASDPSVQTVFSAWKSVGERITLSNDYSGYQPLFYYASEREFMASPSILKLIALGASSELDDLALSIFCRCGFFLGEQTAFKAIKAMPPGGTVEWVAGKLTVQGQPLIVSGANLTSKEAAEGYAHFFSQAIGRRLPTSDDFDIMLTGGKDSRQILLELHKRGYSPKRCISGGDPRDREISSQLASSIGALHSEVAPLPRSGLACWQKNELTNFCAIEHAWLMHISNHLNQFSTEVYEGTGVGVLTRSELLADEYQVLYANERFEELAQLIFSTVGPREQFFKLLANPFGNIAVNYDNAVQAMAAELKRYREAANPMTAFNFWNWNRRAIATWPFNLANRKTAIRTPFLDKDLYLFVASIAPETIKLKEPQKHAISLAFPEASKIPYYDAMPAKKLVKRQFAQRSIDSVTRLLTVARSGAANMQSYCKMRLLEYRTDCTPRNRSSQKSTFLYLTQLQVQSKRQNAVKALQWRSDGNN